MTLQEFVDRYCVGKQYDSCCGTPCAYSGGAGCIHPLHPKNSVYNPPAVVHEAPLEVRAGTPLGVDPLGFTLQ